MKKRKICKAASRIALSAIVLAMLASCGGDEPAVKTELADVKFPVQEDITLKIWGNNIHTVVKNYSEMGVIPKAEGAYRNIC